MKAKLIKTKDCIPMPELERQFYDQSNYRYLRKIIETEGFKQCYPVRGIFNGRKGVYEVFDGIHRTKIAQDLGIPKIPLIDETGILTRQKAIAEGIKANKTHAFYNPMDMAKHLKVLGESLSEVRKKNGSVGRPESISLEVLSRETGISPKSISQYLQLLRLPEDVQSMLGQGKLKFSYALALLRLDKTHRFMIPKLAEEVYKNGLSRKELERKIDQILKKGYYADTKVCVGCKKAFPVEHLSNPCLCPSCVQKLRSEKIEETEVKPTRLDERTKAMRDYLGLNALLDERWTKRGKEIPRKARERLEVLHSRWKNSFDENVETEDDIAVRDFLEDAIEGKED